MRVMEPLRARWTAERRARVVEGFRDGRWPEFAHWPDVFDARPDLRGIDLRGVRLDGLDLSDVRLDGADLRGATLSRVRMHRTSLAGASLAGCKGIALDAFASCFRDAVLDDAVLSRAVLAGCNLAKASLTRTCLREADLRSATLYGARLLGCTMQGALLAGADIEEALVAGCSGFRPNRHNQDHFDRDYPVFAPLVRRYSTLKNALSSEAQYVAEGCIHGVSAFTELHGLVVSDDWRTQLAGAAALIVRGSDRAPFDLLWHMIARGSWVVPQLACAAYLIGPAFADRARVLLKANAADVPCAAADRVPEYSRVAVKALLDGGLPDDVEADADNLAVRKLTLEWLERTKSRLLPFVRERLN